MSAYLSLRFVGKALQFVGVVQNKQNLHLQVKGQNLGKRSKYVALSGFGLCVAVVTKELVSSGQLFGVEKVLQDRLKRARCAIA